MVAFTNTNNYIEQTKLTFFENLSCKINNKKRNEVIGQNIDVCTGIMRQAFENDQLINYHVYTEVGNYLTTLLRDKKLTPETKEKLLQLDRWLTGYEKGVLKCIAEYRHSENKKLFDENDTRLLGASKDFAEANPDYVEFVLKNNISNWFHRVNPGKVFETNAEGQPLIPFANFDMQGKTFTQLSTDDISARSYDWKTAKENLVKEQSLDKDSYLLTGRQMTLWGLVLHHNFDWQQFVPITKVEPPHAPVIQVISYHPQRNLVPEMMGDQGHVGVIYIDREGFVYSFGFFCPPPPVANFYAALKPQTSYIRSPDLYEQRHGASYQELAAGHVPDSQDIAWNYGALQLKFSDDTDLPCVQKVINIWKELKKEAITGTEEEIAAKQQELDGIRGHKRNLKQLIKSDARRKVIQSKSNELFVMMAQYKPTLHDPQSYRMTAQEKFMTMMERVVELQKKTVEARETCDWSNGAIPYMLAEQNCAHVGRLHFGRFAEVFLGAEKDKKVVDSRPGHEQYLPELQKSPFTRLEWAKVTLANHVLGRIARFLFVTPYVSSSIFGRGTAGEGIKPMTSFWGCLKNLITFRSSISPAAVREESMEVERPIKSFTRRFFKWFSKPTSILPQHRG